MPCGQLYRHDRTDHNALGVRGSYVLFWFQIWNKHNTPQWEQQSKTNQKRINKNRTAPLKIHFLVPNICIWFGCSILILFKTDVSLAGCFDCIVLRMSCYCKCYDSSSRCRGLICVVWMCISWSYSLTLLYVISCIAIYFCSCMSFYLYFVDMVFFKKTHFHLLAGTKRNVQK